MKYKLLILAWLTMSCDVLSPSTDGDYYASFYLQIHDSKYAKVVNVSSDVNFGDLLMKRDLWHNDIRQRMVYNGRLTIVDEEIVGIDILEQDYLEYEYVYEEVLEITIEEWIGSFVLASNQYEGVLKTYAMSHLVAAHMETRYYVDKQKTMRVIISRNGSLDTIEALI